MHTTRFCDERPGWGGGCGGRYGAARKLSFKDEHVSFVTLMTRQGFLHRRNSFYGPVLTVIETLSESLIGPIVMFYSPSLVASTEASTTSAHSWPLVWVVVSTAITASVASTVSYDRKINDVKFFMERYNTCENVIIT